MGVYGIVALLVRIDDAGLALMKRDAHAAQKLGAFMVAALPWTIKGLSFVGTVALLLVSGGIFHHHLPGIHALIHAWPSSVADATLGLVGGALVLVAVSVTKRLLSSVSFRDVEK